MTAPKLASTRPAALTGRVGQGGDNCIHDIALVQALLGLKRAKNGRMYLRDNHVTGKFDRATADALKQFRTEHRDGNMGQPLARSGPVFNKLAQGQALAVLEGTATPYKLATLAEPGEIKSEAGKILSAERKAALHETMKDFISDWGIALNVEVKVAANNLPPRSNASSLFESRPLVAHFTPRNLWVHNGRTLSNVPDNALFRAKAKLLFETVEADLKARCAQAFGIKDRADMKIQNGLKDDLACVVRTDLESVEALAQYLLALGRKFGLRIAVRFFERYLKASGESIELNRDDALEFDLARNGMEENTERFKQQTFVAPNKSNKAHTGVEGISTKPDMPIANISDTWDLNFTHDTIAGISRLIEGAGSDFQDTIAAILGPGRSTLTSTGDFLLQRQGNRVDVAGAIVHVWTDPAFDFDPGRLCYEEAQILERHKKAAPFKWEAKWEDGVLGEFEIDNLFSPNATRKWIKFELNPLS